MRTRILRVLSLTLCVVMVLALAACNTSTNPPAASTNPGSSSATPNATEQTAPYVSDEEIELTFWHIWGSGDPSSAAVEKVINDWNALGTNVKINVETYENDAYKQKIERDVPGGTAPDIFSSWGAGYSKPFVDAGKVLQIDSYLNDGTKDRMLPGALDHVTYDGKLYGLTFGMAASGFFCNNRLFEENNVKIPETWDELVSAVETFKAAGITPIGTSIKEKWVVSMLFEGLALKTTGATAIMKALTEGGDAFGDAGFLLAAQKMMELSDMGAINEDANAISRDENEVSITAGEVPIYYMGSWAAGTLNGDEVVDKGNFTFIPFPTIPEGNGSASELNGGATDCIMISAGTKYPEAAAAFVKYYCENVAREGYLAGSYSPAWDIGSVGESNNPIISSLKDNVASASAFVMWWDTFLGTDLAAIYQDALVELLNKQITPEQFVEKLQTIQP